MANVLQIDYSTLNLERLRKLPVHKKPETYEYQRGMGNGCSGDPPGYPTYFTQNVYTQYGNSPRRGAELVIRDPETGLYHVVQRAEWAEGETWEVRQAKQDKLIASLWIQLPIDHPRTVAWIRDKYRHARHCYIDDSQAKNDQTVIYPVPDYKLQAFRDDERFSDEWREREKQRVADANAEIEAYFVKIAIPENHSAYRRIVEFYPDVLPDFALIADPGTEHAQTWWETLAERPTPENCPGNARRGSGDKHPANKTWCQVCGYAAAP